MIEIREERASASGPAVIISCAAGGAGAVARCVELALRLGHSRLVVDLGRRDDADADVLGALRRSARRMREAGGRLAVVSADPGVRRLLEITLLGHDFPVYATREEALAA